MNHCVINNFVSLFVSLNVVNVDQSVEISFLNSGFQH